jgi:hypothetical protein
MKLNKIKIYPIKSLDGIEVSTIRVNPSGALKHDRQFALFTKNGKTVNAKKYPEIIQIKANFDIDNLSVKLSVNNSESEFELRNNNALLSEWFSDYFKENVILKENTSTGFPDDTERPGPTICSLESIKLVNKWFPDYSEDNIRRRFRSNLELSQNENGFWEDLLLKQSNSPKLRIGQLELNLIKPCPRCPVPSRDPNTSEVHSGFQIDFERNRKNLMPEVDKRFYPHFYMFGINTSANLSKEVQININDDLSL